MVAANLKLNNLTIMLDFNRSQVRSLQIPNPAERFAAFCCDTIETNGHDLEALKAALAKPAGTVKVVVAQTTKGHGCPRSPTTFSSGIANRRNRRSWSGC